MGGGVDMRARVRAHRQLVDKTPVFLVRRMRGKLRLGMPGPINGKVVVEGVGQINQGHENFSNPREGGAFSVVADTDRHESGDQRLRRGARRWQ